MVDKNMVAQDFLLKDVQMCPALWKPIWAQPASVHGA